MPTPTLQHFELHVLLAMLREGGETYSVPLVLALEKRTGRPVAQAAVFIALKRLERKGLVTSRLDEPDDRPGPPLLHADAGRASPPSRPTASSTRGCGRASTACCARTRPDMRWLLRLLVDDDDRRAIESDLAELYDYAGVATATAAADRWLRRQRRVYPWHLLVDRVRAALAARNDHAASLARRPLHACAAWRASPRSRPRSC